MNGSAVSDDVVVFVFCEDIKVTVRELFAVLLADCVGVVLFCCGMETFEVSIFSRERDDVIQHGVEVSLPQ